MTFWGVYVTQTVILPTTKEHRAVLYQPKTGRSGAKFTPPYTTQAVPDLDLAVILETMQIWKRLVKMLRRTVSQMYPHSNVLSIVNLEFCLKVL